MRLAWMSRLFFATVAGLAVAGVLSGTACTKWGKAGPIPPTITPLSSIYVDPTIGSDSTGNGSASKPYKTLTKAVVVLGSAKIPPGSSVTIYLSGGDYTASNGEKFPIVVPTSVTISGANFGGGPRAGTFIDGAGEDTLFEALVHAPPRSNYATLEIAVGADVSMSNVYVGDSHVTLPSSHTAYASLDVIGTLLASTVGLGAGIVSALPYISGVIVPGGSFNCASCQIRGNDFGVGALSVVLPTSSPSPSSSPYGTSSPYSTGPAVTLSRSRSDSNIEAKVADILTDGTASVTVSGEGFERSEYAFTDALRPIINIPTRGAVDFGGGVAGSPGGNAFIGARIAEISIVRRSETISALDDIWNPGQQGANLSGYYTKAITFRPGAVGKNVKISKAAFESMVFVGPAAVPTPTPSSIPSSTPSLTPTP